MRCWLDADCRTWWRCCVVAVAVLVGGLNDEASAADRPRVLFSTPLALIRGETNKVALRGLFLDGVSSVTVPLESGPMLVSKGSKVGVPNGLDGKKVGDTQAEFELTLPAAFKEDRIVVRVGAEAAQEVSLPVLERARTVEEKEPNEGFRQSQSIEVGQTVRAAFHQQRDVDVFQVSVKAGQKLVVQVLAAKLGSPTDATLQVFQADRRLLASSDDSDGRDPKLSLTASRDDVWFVSVTEANDNGGPLHHYLLTVSPDR